MLIALVVVAVAGAPPDEQIDFEDFFRPKKKEKGEKVVPRLCPVCGKPLWKHAEPGFVCQDPSKRPAPVLRREVTCPVCGHSFAAPLRRGKAARGGTDSDFCTHPVGSTAVTSNVWMCVGCGYAALQGDFEEPVDAETKKFVKKQISKATDRRLREMIRFKAFPNLPLDFLRLEDVPDTLEYENALVIYSFKNAPGNVLARLHLEASYAYRREFCAPLMCEHIFRAIREVDAMLVAPASLDDTIAGKIARARELVRSGRNLSRDELYCVSVGLASLYARLGEGWNARKELVRALSLAANDEKPEKAADLKKIVHARLLSLARESQHQDAACQHMMETIEGGTLEGDGLLNAVYLVGELHKRLGRLEEAASWLRAAKALLGEEKEGLARVVEEALSNPLLRSVTPEAETLARPLRLLGLDAELERALAEAGERERKETEEVEHRAEVEAERAALTCRQVLERIYRAAMEYQKTRGGIPASFAELTGSGLLVPEDVNGFICPESRAPLFYRRAKVLAGRDFIVFHKKPTKCTCRLVLLADGTVGTVDE